MKTSEILTLLAQDKKLSDILKNNNLENQKNDIINQLLNISNSLSKLSLDKNFENELELDLFAEPNQDSNNSNSSNSSNSSNNLDENELFVYSDGAVSGNPGIGGIGCVILNKSGLEIAAQNKNIGIVTNNIAEYKAILLAVDILLEINAENKKINFFADSELMVKQIKGEYKIANAELKKLNLEFFEKIKNFKNYKIAHVFREKNQIADNLAVLAKSNKIINRRIK